MKWPCDIQKASGDDRVEVDIYDDGVDKIVYITMAAANIGVGINAEKIDELITVLQEARKYFSQANP